MKTKEIWVLVTTDERQILGEKSVVSLHKSLNKARREMLDDMNLVAIRRGLPHDEIECDHEQMFAQTKDRQYCWSLERWEV